jgi:hypothetical protein
MVNLSHLILKAEGQLGVEVIVERILTRAMTTPTVTENGALYFAQHKASRARAALFRRFRKPLKVKRLELGQLTFGDKFILPRIYRDRASS